MKPKYRIGKVLRLNAENSIMHGQEVTVMSYVPKNGKIFYKVCGKIQERNEYLWISEECLANGREREIYALLHEYDYYKNHGNAIPGSSKYLHGVNDALLAVGVSIQQLRDELEELS